MDNKDNNQKDDQKKKQINILSIEKGTSIGYQLGFILHDNFSLHILLTLIVNLLSSAVIIGLYSTFYKVIEVHSFESFFIGLILYTVMEIIIKLILIRFAWKILIQTFGFIFFILNLTLFFIVSLLVPGFTFLRNPSNIFIYTLSFMAFRLLL